jgi:hypothetical protein
MTGSWMTRTCHTAQTVPALLQVCMVTFVHVAGHGRSSTPGYLARQCNLLRVSDSPWHGIVRWQLQLLC